ncbi:hypothetical protein PAPHI01_1921 [Pancytospora philotis]|nr:hypothetical protein PAPHI01_1921 [Pancytospora philotis]
MDGGKQQSVLFVIPKDPRTDDTLFLTGLPYGLHEAITPEEWKLIIDGINGIITNKEQPSFLNAIRVLLLFPLIVSVGSYDADLSRYLDDVNQSLLARGIFIRNPTSSCLTELEVVYAPSTHPS